MRAFVQRWWKWLVGGGLLALLSVIILRDQKKLRAAELKLVDATHLPKIEQLREEQKKLEAKLGQDHAKVKAAEERVVQAEVKIAEKYEAKGLTPEEIVARFKQLGRG